MRCGLRIVAFFVPLFVLLLSPTTAGIIVTSYSTTALTNGFAPSLQGPYFEQQTLANFTPALAQVSGDWIGPNADGTPNTWHYVGSSQSSSTTTFDANSFAVLAAGSFEYKLDTTTAFVDPQPSVFAPGGAANYNGRFMTDLPASYVITATLNQWGRVRLNSIGTGLVLFDQTNPTTTPVTVNFNGTIPPGEYRVLITAGLAAPGFPNGVNHYEASGSYENVMFSVQVPDPSVPAVVILIVVAKLRGRSRSLERAKDH